MHLSARLHRGGATFPKGGEVTPSRFLILTPTLRQDNWRSSSGFSRLDDCSIVLYMKGGWERERARARVCVHVCVLDYDLFGGIWCWGNIKGNHLHQGTCFSKSLLIFSSSHSHTCARTGVRTNLLQLRLLQWVRRDSETHIFSAVVNTCWAVYCCSNRLWAHEHIRRSVWTKTWTLNTNSTLNTHVQQHPRPKNSAWTL